MSDYIDLSADGDTDEPHRSVSIGTLAKRVIETLDLEGPARKRSRTYVAVDDEPNNPAQPCQQLPAAAGTNNLLSQLHAERHARMAGRQADAATAPVVTAHSGQGQVIQPLWPHSINTGQASVPASPSRHPSTAPVGHSTFASNLGLGAIAAASTVSASFLSFNIGYVHVCWLAGSCAR